MKEGWVERKKTRGREGDDEENQANLPQEAAPHPSHTFIDVPPPVLNPATSPPPSSAFAPVVARPPLPPSSFKILISGPCDPSSGQKRHNQHTCFWSKSR